MTTTSAGTTCQEITEYLDQELSIAAIADSSLNGLQVQGSRIVHKLATAVDASLETFQAAHKLHADMLLVHHGLFWGELKPITGIMYERLEFLLRTGMALYASHLPLDLHPRLGNNAQLAKSLGLSRCVRFGNYHGELIGFGGQWPRPQGLMELSRRLEKAIGQGPQIFAFGPKKIKRVAVVSGGAGDLVEQAAAEGYDAFVTGEATHQVFHPAKEMRINLILGGHYATETLGVKILSNLVEKRFGIQSIFIDIPTSL